MATSTDCTRRTARLMGATVFAAGRRRTRLFPVLFPCVLFICTASASADAWSVGAAPAPAQSPQSRTDSQPRAERIDPLLQAARAGDVKRVASLLAGGADVNGSNGHGGTALMYAVVGNHGDVVELLLRRGADVNARGSNGWGALMIASAKGFAGVVRRLLQAGADRNAVDLYGWTPLMRAVYEKRAAVVALLVNSKRTDLNAVTDQGSTALHLAAVVGAVELARTLLDHGADASILDAEGRSAADIADARGDRGLAHLLRVRSYSSARGLCCDG